MQVTLLTLFLFFQILHSSLAGVLRLTHPASQQEDGSTHTPHTHSARPQTTLPAYPTAASGAQMLPRNSYLPWLGAVGPTLGYLLLYIYKYEHTNVYRDCFNTPI